MKKSISKYRKFQHKKVFLSIITLLILTAAIIAGACRYNGAGAGVNHGKIGFCMQDGKLLVSWQTVSDGNKYRFSRYDEDSGEYIFYGEYDGGSAELADIVPGQELKLEMQQVRTVNVFGRDREIAGRRRILTVIPEKLDAPVLIKTADVDNKSMKITWDTAPGSRYEVYLSSEEGTPFLYSEIEKGEITLSMEDYAELSGREQGIEVAVRAIRRMDDYILYSAISEPAKVSRVDLMENELHLEYAKNGENRYILSWQESKGDWYELQEWSYSDKEWIGRQVYRWSDSLACDTGRLPSCTEVRYRVITYNDPEAGDGETLAVEPSEITFRTELTPVYCTIWPLTALDISEDISGESVTGRVPAGETLCVLEEKEGCFLVRYEDKYGYIDSRYCLIDLAEYLGNLCEYDITNSYASIFRVHGYEIPEVTDSVVKGYENVYMENGRTLVPYLYPCARKLYQAALHAQEDGYALRIYDAFRPNEATRYLYDAAEAILNRPVMTEDSEMTADEQEDAAGQPDDAAERQEDAAGQPDDAAERPEDTAEWPGDAAETTELPEVSMDEVRLLSDNLSPDLIGTVKGLSEDALAAFYMLPQELLINPGQTDWEGPDAGSIAALAVLSPEDLLLLQGLSPEDVLLLKGMTWEELAVLKWYLDNTLTYLEVMTDNRFRLGSFLAQSVSTHNRGIALDLTLVSVSADEELKMQSDMHDLSWYSILAQNNENADLLNSYMKEAGYNDLVSEWWHFQDDETRNELNLGYLETGVSPEGFKRDELGWKYRLADGSYYRAVTVMIGQKERIFDEDGYLIEE